VAGDPVARQLFGWADLAARVEIAMRDAGGGFVAAEPYGLASELAWILPPGTDVVNVGAHWEPMDRPRSRMPSRRGILIRPERYGDAPGAGEWLNVRRLAGIARTTSGAEIERYALFEVEVTDEQYPGQILPHR